MSLAGQYLVLQLLIVLAVLVAVVAISLAQSAATFERNEGRRALLAAEALGSNPTVRALLPEAEPRVGSASGRGRIRANRFGIITCGTRQT